MHFLFVCAKGKYKKGTSTQHGICIVIQIFFLRYAITILIQRETQNLGRASKFFLSAPKGQKTFFMHTEGTESFLCAQRGQKAFYPHRRDRKLFI
jgi:hypothetical protein